jgi:Tfp pilus assembly protein PilN
VVAAAAKEANDLIEQRTFSWTGLFNLLESTLPDDVMLTTVHPEFKDGQTEVNLDVQGRRSDDIDAFWDRLEKTGSFRDVGWSAVNVSDEGLHRIQMKALYTPPAPGAAQPPSVAPVPVAPIPVPLPVAPPTSKLPASGPPPAKGKGASR